MDNKEIILYQSERLQEMIGDIKSLEDKIIDLSEDKLEIEKKIYRFNNEYNEKVGTILVKYLQKREELVAQKYGECENEEQKEALKKKHENAQEDVQTFQAQQANNKTPIKKLTLEEEQELKLLYKKACRLCHPDMVDELFKEEAIAIFHQLNLANQRKDLPQVREILKQLEIANFSMTSLPSDIEVLKKRKTALGAEVIKIELEIGELKNDSTYQRIQNIKDWQRYFKVTAMQLEKEIYKQELNF